MNSFQYRRVSRRVSVSTSAPPFLLELALNHAQYFSSPWSFDTHPHTTLALTGGILNSFGDFVAQLVQNIFGREALETPPGLGYNFARTFRFFCFRFTISPFIGRWNHFLEYKYPLHSINGSGRASVKALSKRVACDQMIMAPIGLSIFLGSMGIMEGRAPQQIRQKYNDLYKTALLTNWKVWPLAQLINFRYMSLPYRVPFQSTCGVFWTLYLSIINSKDAIFLFLCSFSHIASGRSRTKIETRSSVAQWTPNIIL